MERAKKETIRQPYGLYHRRRLPAEDGELTHVGPETPCGEYLRRFWQPVAMSSELGGDGIRVNAICPGSVEGPRIEAVYTSKARLRGVAPEVVRDEMIAKASLRRMVSAEDIANAIVFLASQAGANISGHALPVDADTQALV